MPIEFKCFDCGGIRVHGLGNPQKATMGFHKGDYYFCRACGDMLNKDDRAKDKEKIAQRMRDDAVAEFKVAWREAMVRMKERAERGQRG